MNAPGPEILVIDDELQIRRLLRFTLEDAGYRVRDVDSGHRGLVEVAHRSAELVILDLGLPDLSGIEVLRRMREWTEIPVLVLSVFGQEGKKVEALDAGADDYLTKPFGGAELLARLRALLRRAKTEEPVASVRFGAIEVDLVNRRVLKHGQPVKLTAREYEFLHLLVSHRDKVLTHTQILNQIWGEEANAQTHYLRVFMMRLRRKIEDDPDQPRYLQTEPGIGYRLVSS